MLYSVNLSDPLSRLRLFLNKAGNTLVDFLFYFFQRILRIAFFFHRKKESKVSTIISHCYKDSIVYESIYVLKLYLGEVNIAGIYTVNFNFSIP